MVPFFLDFAPSIVLIYYQHWSIGQSWCTNHPRILHLWRFRLFFRTHLQPFGHSASPCGWRCFRAGSTCNLDTLPKNEQTYPVSWNPSSHRHGPATLFHYLSTSSSSRYQVDCSNRHHRSLSWSPGNPKKGNYFHIHWTLNPNFQILCLGRWRNQAVMQRVRPPIFMTSKREVLHCTEIPDSVSSSMEGLVLNDFVALRTANCKLLN